MSKQILVVAAAIENNLDEVLIAQRPAGGAIGGLWEFPGGKIEFGESPQRALEREIEEELGLKIEVGGTFGVSHFVTGGSTPQQIILLGFRAKVHAQSAAPQALGVAAWRWVSRQTQAADVLQLVNWAPADFELVRAYFPR
ncbi:MAG TPA: (deoxy)nucleoside triphosphate pyrophosphohydrolase [Pseudobdellovibrionaceae bacterium]|nr:(deoxy)nucleoside triphosphate pyrophosphohydrolase [Pseudobdellovibrionaceae bacterium]